MEHYEDDDLVASALLQVYATEEEVEVEEDVLEILEEDDQKNLFSKNIQ